MTRRKSNLNNQRSREAQLKRTAKESHNAQRIRIPDSPAEGTEKNHGERKREINERRRAARKQTIDNLS